MTIGTFDSNASRVLAAGALVAASALASGCLSRTHMIPQRELHQLAQTPPEQRGDRVRVIQRFSTSSEPPEAPGVHAHTHVYVPVHVHTGPRGVAGRPGKPGRRPPNLGKAKADKAAFWVLVAVGAAVGLAATEGARFDGWVNLHPMHPVHLYGPGGQYTWMPLAHIDPGTAAWATRAYVRESEGPWRRLERAPLNRRGWTYGVLLGAAEFPSGTDSERTGFMSHIQMGLFWAKHIGVLLDIGLGWADNELGQTVFDSRWAGELQVLPLAAGRVHAGVFGQVGAAARFEDAPGESDTRDMLYGGGALLQLELTTRLAITGRAGITRVYDATANDFTIGLSIY